jgi:hypothetical protein
MMPAMFVVCAPGWRSPDRAIAGDRHPLVGNTESAKKSAGIGRQGWIAMGQAQPFQGRFSPTFLLILAAAGIASAAAVGVLYAIHAVQVSDVAGRSAELTALHTPLGDGLSAEERRELTRQMLKARRENPEIPAQVRPTPSSRPATTADAAAPAAPAAPAGPAGAKVRPDRLGAGGATPAVAVGTPPGPGGPPAARGVARNKPDAPVQTAALPPSASPAASAAVGLAPGAALAAPAAPAAVPPVGSTPAPGVALPLVIVPSTPGVTPPPGLIVGEPNARAQAGGDPAAGAAGAAASEPERRSIAASVFSTISGFAGTAANATGNTVNWVIDLPGKAISAGGRLLGGDSAGNRQPAAPPAPNRS